MLNAQTQLLSQWHECTMLRCNTEYHVKEITTKGHYKPVHPFLHKAPRLHDHGDLDILYFSQFFLHVSHSI